MGRRRAQDGETVRQRLSLTEKSGPLGGKWQSLRACYPPLLIPALFTSSNSPFGPRSEPTPPPPNQGAPSPAKLPCHFTALLHVPALVTLAPPGYSLGKYAASLGQECQQKVKSMARDTGRRR